MSRREVRSVRIYIGPPAGGDDSDVAFDQPRDEPPFAVAEVTLTVTLEHFGGRIARCSFDFGIAIDEGQAEALGQAAPDR